MRAAALTGQQTEAVELGDSAHLITAPPGSGKTEVLVQRVIHLLGGSPRDLFRILALTYTVKAAQELKDRAQIVVPEEDLWRVNATTFHSFALGILENYGSPVGLKRPITVISDLEDKRALVVQTLEEQVGQLGSVDRSEWQRVFDEIARRKTNLDQPVRNGRDRVLNGRIRLSDAYEAYEAALTNTGSVDYEGMIYQTVRLIKIDPWVGSHIRRQYRHILVDEGQELTQGQYELLKAIQSDKHQSFFVVADIDQSINSFAGGGPRFLREFVSDFGASEHNLTTNFRSAKAIVDILSTLRHNIGEPDEPTPIDSGNLASGWVGACSYANDEHEAQAVGEWIRSILEEGLDPEWVYKGEATDVAAEDFCVLGRTRYAFAPLVEDLKGHGVPFSLRAEEKAIFESRLGRSGLYALKLTQNPGDLPARRRLREELGEQDSEGRNHHESASPRAILQDCADHGNLPQEFVEALLFSDTATANGLQAVAALIAIDEISTDLDHEEEAAWHRDQGYLEHLLTSYETSTSAPNRSLSGFLRMLSRLEGVPPSEPGVRILTPHRARGLGFKVVIVLGMNEGNFPHYRATSPDELDEERRVVYVAASRAARALLLTRPRSRLSRYGNWYPCQESPFIGEMGLTMENVAL